MVMSDQAALRQWLSEIADCTTFRAVIDTYGQAMEDPSLDIGAKIQIARAAKERIDVLCQEESE
jgi:hypothetical protein